MNNTDMLFVQKKLNNLIGWSLVSIHRACDLLCLDFADATDFSPNRHEQSLHIQCYHRLCRDGHVILARSDYFQPSEDMWQQWKEQGLEEDVIPDTYRCDEVDANRLDDRIAALSEEISVPHNTYTLRAVMVDSIGDLTLCFDNGAVWSILIDTSGGEECWRYLSGNEESLHLVIYSDGIECE